MAALVRHRDEGPATWFVNGLAVTKATTADTGGAYALAEHLVSAAANPPHHVHTDEEEAWYVLDGEIEFEVAGETAVAHPGSFVLSLRGEAHTFRVVTDTARMLVISSSPDATRRGDFERFVDAVGTPATARVLPEPAAPDPAVLTTVAAEYGIEILPPPA